VNESAVPVDRVHQGDARAVGEVGVGRRVEDDQVGARAGGQVADVGAAQGAGAARRRRPDRLLRGHVHVADREGDAERHRRGVGRAGVAVGRQRDRHAGVKQAAGVRIGLPGAELRAGEQGRDGARRGECGHVGIGEERAVVRRGGVKLHRQPDAGTGTELARVDPGEQAARHGRGEHRARLVLAERAALAEHVGPAAVRRAGVKHGAAHQVKVGGGTFRELGGQHVRAQVGDLRGDLGGQRHRAGLVAGGEPVA
jgi:hypothetical protein